MLSTIWFSEDWAEALLIVAAVCAAVLAVVEVTARNTAGALLPVAVALIALALLAF